MKTLFKLPITFLLLITMACAGDENSETTDDNDPIVSETISVVNAFPNLRFSRPVDLQCPADNSNRIFVVEQQGRIRVFTNDPNVAASSNFLDIRDRVFDGENEMGLLGMVFHPNFESNGYFYVSYTTTRSLSVISRFQTMPNDPDRADISSELVLMEIPQPFVNHNGGQLAFGPDGFLYIASGDGGSGGDPQGNAQNTSNLLGAILRINVDQTMDGLNYGIPATNPFVSTTEARGEIFAYGLRNPWRMSFDTSTGALWSGDVGQDRLEEINIIALGNNYGWNILEGNRCFTSDDCDNTVFSSPVFEYNHNAGDVSITGGYVYRGNAVPLLNGRYVYGDFESGRIWSLDANFQGGEVDNQLIANTNLNIASFGTDAANELYICSFDGIIYGFEQN